MATMNADGHTNRPALGFAASGAASVLLAASAAGSGTGVAASSAGSRSMAKSGAFTSGGYLRASRYTASSSIWFTMARASTSAAACGSVLGSRCTCTAAASSMADSSRPSRTASRSKCVGSGPPRRRGAAEAVRYRRAALAIAAARVRAQRPRAHLGSPCSSCSVCG